MDHKLFLFGCVLMPLLAAPAGSYIGTRLGRWAAKRELARYRERVNTMIELAKLAGDNGTRLRRDLEEMKRDM